MSKLKFYYRVDGDGNPIPGSNLKKYSKPDHRESGKWRELSNPCCDPVVVSCICDDDFRFFVQLDNQNNPVDYSLIKRKTKPQRPGFKCMEVATEDCCPYLEFRFGTITSCPSYPNFSMISVSGIPGNTPVVFSKPIKVGSKPVRIKRPRGTYTVSVTIANNPPSFDIGTNGVNTTIVGQVVSITVNDTLTDVVYMEIGCDPI